MLGRELGFEAGDDEVEGFIAGFGSTAEILDRISRSPRRALMLSSCREEVLDAILARRLSGALEKGPGAIVLCGPSDSCSMTAEGFQKMGIPLYRTSRTADDSVSIVNKRVFKVEPGESVKISEIVRTVKQNVDLPALLDELRTGDGVSGRKAEKPRGRIRSLITKLFGGR